VRMDTSPLQEGRKILAGSIGLGFGRCKQACDIIVGLTNSSDEDTICFVLNTSTMLKFSCGELSDSKVLVSLHLYYIGALFQCLVC
jgi:hypothetical protein